MLMNFICEDCGELFADHHTECPNCGSYYVEKADFCKTDKCQEYMVHGDYCCEECKKEAKTVLSDALATLDIGQIKYLEALLEDEFLSDFWRKN